MAGITRTARAEWQGTGKEGKGTLSTQSGVLSTTPYGFNTRFGDDKGTNPEELIAAAHAGCFTMALAFALTGAGFTPTRIATSAAVTLEPDGAGFKISKSALKLEASVPNIDPRAVPEDRRGRQGRLPGLQGAERRDHARLAARLIAAQLRIATGHDMQKRKLGNSGLEIAPLMFGGNVFGWTADEATSFKLLDGFVGAGLDCIDTADVYSELGARPQGRRVRDHHRQLAEGARRPRQGRDRHQGRHGDGGRSARACRKAYIMRARSRTR